MSLRSNAILRIIVSFPIIDLRMFLLPTVNVQFPWKKNRSNVYLKCFGLVHSNNNPIDDFGWKYVTDAAHAFSINIKNIQFIENYRIKSKEFFSTVNSVANRIDIEYEIKFKNISGAYFNETDILDFLLNSKVLINKGKWKSKNAEFSFLSMGNIIAEQYLCSTQNITDIETAHLNQTFVYTGCPVIVIEATMDDVNFQPTQNVKHINFDLVNHVICFKKSFDPNINLWIIPDTISKNKDELVNKILKINSELQSLKIIFMNIYKKKINCLSDQQNLTNQQLQAYFLWVLCSKRNKTFFDIIFISVTLQYNKLLDEPIDRKKFLLKIKSIRPQVYNKIKLYTNEQHLELVNIDIWKFVQRWDHTQDDAWEILSARYTTIFGRIQYTGPEILRCIKISNIKELVLLISSISGIPPAINILMQLLPKIFGP
jgi:hypothetical protein